MTPESKMKLNFPNKCFILNVGGKYLNMIGDVMAKVNSVTNYFGGRPLAVFFISHNYNEHISIDIDYDIDRYKSLPVMVCQLLLTLKK